jgi:hypothetical protein
MRKLCIIKYLNFKRQSVYIMKYDCEEQGTQYEHTQHSTQSV